MVGACCNAEQTTTRNLGSKDTGFDDEGPGSGCYLIASSLVFTVTGANLGESVRRMVRTRMDRPHVLEQRSQNQQRPPPGAQPDEVLVVRWQRGDLAAASIVIQRYERMVYGAALRVLRDPHQSEDVAQETFLRAHERIESLRDPRALPGWLKSICVRRAIDLIRRGSPAALEAYDIAESDPGPDEVVQIADALERFRAALLSLPTSLRVAVSLRDVDGLSTREAATTLGITEAALKMRLSRGRRRLRELLRAESWEEL